MAVVDTMTKATQVRERFIPAYSSKSHSTIEGNQDRSLRGDLGRMLLAGLPSGCSFTPKDDGTSQNVLGPTASINIQDSPSQSCPQDQLIIKTVTHRQLKFLASDSRLYQVDS